MSEYTRDDEEVLLLPENVVVRYPEESPKAGPKKKLSIPLEAFLSHLDQCGYRNTIVEMNALATPINGSTVEHAYDKIFGPGQRPRSPLIHEYSKLPSEQKILIAEEFARESNLISGLGLASTRVRVHRKSDTKKTVKRVYADPLFKEHVGLAQAMLGYEPMKDKHLPLNPIATNTAVCGHQTPRWRSGTSFPMRKLLPKAKLVQDLSDAWIRMVEEGIEHFRDASEFEKDVFTWACHDFEVHSEFFDSGNGRSSRLDMQLARIELGLCPTMVRMENMTFHERRFYAFRKGYVPFMLELGYIASN